MNLIKTLLLQGLLICLGLTAIGQCTYIGELNNEYYFINSISRRTLLKYIERCGSMCGSVEGVSVDPYYLTTDFNEDIEMFAGIQPGYITKVAGSWRAGSDNDGEFYRAELIACELHGFDPYIILQAIILENIDVKVNAEKDWSVKIPDYVLLMFDQPLNIGADITKIETPMWFYYTATQYIRAGYASISFGDIKNYDGHIFTTKFFKY